MDGLKGNTPRLGQKLLEWFCPNELLECISGDLQESFEEDLLQHGLSGARRRYYWNMIRFFHPEILFRNKFEIMTLNRALWRNNLKISYRHLIRGRIYSLINITGLSLGMAVCLLIICYTQHHQSFDTFHPDVDRMYRVNQTNIWNPEGGIMSSTAPPLAERIMQDFAEVEAAMRINTPGRAIIRHRTASGDIVTHNESSILAADSNFFEFFPIDLIAGDYRNSLTGYGNVVINESTAKKYFGDQNALGQLLEYGDSRTPLTVSAVAKDLPVNMHFNFDFLLSMPTNPNVEEFDWSWIWTQMVTYVKVKQGTRPQFVNEKMKEISDRHIRGTFGRLGMDFEDFVSSKGGWNFYLQPVTDIHLQSNNIGNRIGPTVDGQVVGSFKLLAMLILIVAMINFVNLSTARSNTRHKELGMKKTLGAHTRQLAGQLLTESVLISTIACMIAVPLLIGLRYLVASLMGIIIPLDMLSNPLTIASALLASVLIGITAGAYPTLTMTRFSISKNLKGGSERGDNTLVRNSLVVMQFAVSMALITGTILIFQQLSYLQNKDLGFDQEHVLIINNAERLGDQLESFRNELSNDAGVASASVSMDIPGRGSWEDIYMREGSNVKLPISQLKIDDHFFPTLNLELISGRIFDKERPADNHSVIINETTARLFGWTNEEALGEKILYPGYPEEIRVIGIVDDFHFQSLREEIAPLMFFNLRSSMWGDMRVVSVKYVTDDISSLIRSISTVWSKYADHVPFEYSFYDQELAMLYEQEEQLGHLIALFGGLTLVIALIGIIGLITYSVQRKKKEIGIRKVLGASVFRIYMMINEHYLRLMLISLIISVPLAWSSLQAWLDNFAFSIGLHPGYFLLSAALVLILSGLSVAYLSISAASVQPTEVLKDD